jgi:Lysozyme like domain
MPVLTDAQIASYAIGAGFTGSDVGIAVAIALAESGGNTDAKNTANRNGSQDDGLMQINTIHKALRATGNVYNPADNMRMARSVFTSAGNRWTPWSTYNSGSYLRFLSRGRAAAGAPDSSGAVGGSIPGGVGGSTNAASDPTAGLSYFTNPGLWARVGVFVLGGALLVFALWKLTGVGGTAVKVAKTAVRARTGLKL